MLYFGRMEEQNGRLWAGVRTLIGTMVGVGIFALPSVFASAGYFPSLLEMVFICGLNLVMLYLYADLILVRGGHGRFQGVVGRDLGVVGKWLAFFAFYASHFFVMVAYILVGGTFAHTVLSSVLPAPLIVYQVVFWLVGSVALSGGLFFVSKIQSYIVPALLLLITLLIIGAVPHISFAHLTTVHTENLLLPFPAILFAFAGMSALPEMRDVLMGEKKKLRTALLLGTAFVFVLYALFSLAIVGVTGANTTGEAVLGLSLVAGHTFAAIGSLLGAVIVFSAFLTVGVSLADTLHFDAQYDYSKAWLVTVIVPIVLFLVGARDVVEVIRISGGILSSLLGILLIVAYERARASHELPKRALGVPQGLVLLSFLLFVAMMAASVFAIFR